MFLFTLKVQEHGIALRDCRHGDMSIPFCDWSVPDYKLCYVEDVTEDGYCGVPFIDIVVYVMDTKEDTLVIRNEGFRSNFQNSFYRNASVHTSGKFHFTPYV